MMMMMMIDHNDDDWRRLFVTRGIVSSFLLNLGKRIHLLQQNLLAFYNENRLRGKHKKSHDTNTEETQQKREGNSSCTCEGTNGAFRRVDSHKKIVGVLPKSSSRCAGPFVSFRAGRDPVTLRDLNCIPLVPNYVKSMHSCELRRIERRIQNQTTITRDTQ